MSGNLPDRLGDSALPEIIKAARLPVLAAITVGAVAFYGPALVTLSGPGGSAGEISGGGGGESLFSQLVTDWSLTVIDTVNAVVADSSAAGGDKWYLGFAGARTFLNPECDATDTGPTIQFRTGATTETGDGAYAMWDLNGVDDACTPAYMTVDVPADSVVLIEVVWMAVLPSWRTDTNSWGKFFGFDNGCANGDAWAGAKPPGSSPRTAGWDDYVEPFAFSHGSGNDLPQGANGATSPSTLTGSKAHSEWITTTVLWSAKAGSAAGVGNRQVITAHDDVIYTHSDSASGSFTWQSCTISNVNLPMITHGGGAGFDYALGDSLLIDRVIVASGN